MSALTEQVALSVIPPLAAAYVRLVAATSRRTLTGEEGFRAVRARRPYILAFWHSRLVLMPYAYPDGRVAVVTSRHRDAEMLRRMLASFGLEFVVGSSTAGGVAALRDMIRRVQAGFDIGIAPDGPRGPRRRVKPGVIAAARLAGVPIVPVTVSASRARRLRSWDRTLVPFPFGRVRIAYGTPMEVPRRGDPADDARHAAELERELDRITDAADADTGLGPEDPRP